MPPFGGTGRAPYADTGNALRRAACEWRRVNPLPTVYPGFFTDPIARAAQRANDRFWDRVCPDVPPPANPPEQPFFGGQCPVFYRMTGFVTQTSGAQAADFESFIQGPLLGADITLTDQPNGQTTWSIFVRDANGNTRTNAIFTGFRSQVNDWYFRLTREDGQPDNCGDSTITPPVVTQPPQVTVNAPVIIGGQEIVGPVTAIDLEINPDNTYTFSPQFEFNGIPFSILPEGVDIDVNPQLSFAPEVNANLNIGSVGGALDNIVSNIPQLLGLLFDILDLIEGGGGGECDLQPLANYIECLLEKPNAQIRTEPITANNSGGVFAIDADCVGVVVNRTGELQPGTKIQSGSGVAPNVEFWGWFAWGNSGNFTERTPLNYPNQFLIPPENVNQVLINPTFGNTFSALEFIEDNSCQFTP